MLWDFPYKTLPQSVHYEKRNAIVVWAGLGAFVLAWAAFGASRDVLWAVALATVWLSSYYSGCATVQKEWDEAVWTQSEREVEQEEKKQEKKWKRLSLYDAAQAYIKAHPGTDYTTASEAVRTAALDRPLQVRRDFYGRHEALRRGVRSKLYG
ncbi:hypothetical protein [Mesorhizobium sp. M2C.T.Ca.TU.002.02.1.1]|uniref:hypothetical protein n=1 Tax=Mesorhizobium sp. M2C.T.Ca.TU.002.02.1.1 TaxID=2496788 RepID=UPI000FCC6BD6|nr:hypothetical protein [Mesorhizobium sp. M2C.T.Ca.TU.002.02.1.1]RUU53913.1 hypothetical protein EOD07_22825 [Mesorhizobium sp. M2C.T.Ca.TU.002.02.1.1]RUU71582.1 hypothetical protein EOD04_02150 [Mesorhizobium sp. M2C.T.Ca.TU.009.01.2.1]